MKPQPGDRIIIKNIPHDYEYRRLYGIQKDGNGQGTIPTDRFNVIAEKGIVPFLTGYTPYKDKEFLDVSGCGYSVDLKKLRFTETAPARFWKFKDGIVKAHNAEYYTELVNWFECEFSDLSS